MSNSHGTRAANALLARHPLQRLSSPSRSVSALIHLAGLLSFTFSFRYLINNPNPMNDAYGWHLQYLTIIGLLLATVTFTVGLLADVTLSRRLFFFKNGLSAASAPMEVLISVLYWTIMAIDPKLVVPDWLPRLALVDDLGFHAAPAIFLSIDLLFLSPPWTISALPAMGLSSLIAVGYWFWTERNYKLNGFWPYPIFDVPIGARAGLFALSAGVMTVSTLTLKWLYRLVNGNLPDDGSISGNIKTGQYAKKRV